jgi:predicted regulator of Ras-like GTPase activity (Roadblock/LC7/MglB family)
MFKQSLERIIDGMADAVGAILMGYDGISVASCGAPQTDIDLSMIGIEYSNIVKEIRQTAEILQSGDLEEVAIKTDHFFVLLRHLNEEYFAVLVLKRSGNSGQGRYRLLRESFWLREELS